MAEMLFFVSPPIQDAAVQLSADGGDDRAITSTYERKRSVESASSSSGKQFGVQEDDSKYDAMVSSEAAVAAVAVGVNAERVPWQCSTCTLENESASPKCVMCGTLPVRPNPSAHEPTNTAARVEVEPLETVWHVQLDVRDAHVIVVEDDRHVDCSAIVAQGGLLLVSKFASSPLKRCTTINMNVRDLQGSCCVLSFVRKRCFFFHLFVREFSLFGNAPFAQPC